MKKHIVYFLTFLILSWLLRCAIASRGDCGPCEEPNNPSLVAFGADPCMPLAKGTPVEGEPCKECDGEGNVMNKSDGKKLEVDGVVGRCCSGVWFAIDQAKEDAECWEWDDASCLYVCSDTEAPLITVEDTKDIELECIGSRVTLPEVSATAIDNCDEDVEVFQSPAVGSGSYGVGDLVIVTIAATDKSGNSAATDVMLRFVCGDKGALKGEDKIIEIELECEGSKVPIPDVRSSLFGNFGDDLNVVQFPEAGSGQYGNGESIAVTVTAIDRYGNSVSGTGIVDFTYQCDTTLLQEARSNCFS